MPNLAPCDKLPCWGGVAAGMMGVLAASCGEGAWAEEGLYCDGQSASKKQAGGGTRGRARGEMNACGLTTALSIVHNL